MMTIEQLKEVMKFQLTNFNDEGVKINDDTVHNTILKTDDGFDHVNSVQLYKDVIRFTLIKQGLQDKAWPNNWLDLNVQQLAEILI